jgi:hypothetical protein
LRGFGYSKSQSWGERNLIGGADGVAGSRFRRIARFPTSLLLLGFANAYLVCMVYGRECLLMRVSPAWESSHTVVFLSNVQ